MGSASDNVERLEGMEAISVLVQVHKGLGLYCPRSTCFPIGWWSTLQGSDGLHTCVCKVWPSFPEAMGLHS